LARQRGAAVRFAGQTNQPEKFLPQMDIFALSSDTEQMPLSLLEAMAAGLPVVATDVGDVRAMLSSCNRPYIFAPGDEDGLRRGLAELVADRTLRERLGATNRHRAEEAFDERGMISRYAHLYGTAAGSANLTGWRQSLSGA
jgi:glycosyltransferase involved in cell wall biosynthesis